MDFGDYHAPLEGAPVFCRHCKEPLFWWIHVYRRTGWVWELKRLPSAQHHHPCEAQQRALREEGEMLR